MKKILAIILCLALALSCIPAVLAADVSSATIDMDAACSLTIFKYDRTNAIKDGIWSDNAFISTGWQESYVETTLGGSDNTLGNGQVSKGYAVKGVEFTILRVADIVTASEAANAQHPDYNMIQLLYGFDKTSAADLLAAIGLANGAQSYPYNTTGNKYYYTSDTINKALATALADNTTAVKNALESYIAADAAAIVMDLTNEYGKTTETDLDVGLYLCVETKVSEQVISTTAPFFVSLPMTTISGDANSSSPAGGTAWNYNVVVYPKQETGIPSLSKEVREAKADTGKNNATGSITDGFQHSVTGSTGDVMEFQIVTSLPAITSQATYLQVYEFFDTLSAGLTYNKALKDVKIEIFTDKSCTDSVAVWTQEDGHFTVTYGTNDRTMTVAIAADGLAEINGNTANINGEEYTGYSNYTVRLTYTATLNADATVVYGDNGNASPVVMTWKRTSLDYYDTLMDDCHVYTYGIDISKVFSNIDAENAEAADMYKNVEFKVYNATDNYWLVAQLNAAEGVYYVTDQADAEADATVFTPVTMGQAFGQVMIKGCEDDEYVITEVKTANGYALLKDNIKVVITAADDKGRPCDIYSQDTKGVLQNDPRFASDNGLDLYISGIPQIQLAHNHLSAAATIDGNNVTMLEDNGSKNAEVPLTVVNTVVFDLPQTGDHGTWMFSLGGILLMAAAAFVILQVCKKKPSEQ